MVKKYTENTKISEHFNSDEFKCTCGCGVSLVDTSLVNILEKLRTKLSCSKIIISSGYRCPTHNKAVGGGPGSRHVKGMAADFACYDKNGTIIKSSKVACALEDLGVFGIGLNCGGNMNYTHADSRESTEKWWGDESKSGYPSIYEINGSESFYYYCGLKCAEYTKFVKSVQKLTGSKVDGIAGNETLHNTITISKNLNNTHPLIKTVQTYLSYLGYSVGEIDGIAGEKFDKAVRCFQKANNCVCDGEITARQKTWKCLLKLV